MKSFIVSATAALAACIVSPAFAGGRAEAKPAFRGVDKATGAEIRVYQQGVDVAVEVSHPSVQIRKELRDGKTTTIIRSGQEQLSIVLDRESLVVSTPQQRVSAGAQHPERVRAAQALIARSRAASRAEALIARLDIAPQSPLRHSLLATRALLLSASSTASASDAVARATRELRASATATRRARAEEDDGGPTECWIEYAKEAIAAYMEYEGCMNGEEWWDILGQVSCALIYDLRAIGAFSWWLGCVGLRG